MRLIVISGRSGSGKSTALNQLEDEGYYCIDNLPASLLPSLVEKTSGHEFELFQGTAVCIDARNAWRDLGNFGSILESLPPCADTIRPEAPGPSDPGGTPQRSSGSSIPPHMVTLKVMRIK